MPCQISLALEGGWWSHNVFLFSSAPREKLTATETKLKAAVQDKANIQLEKAALERELKGLRGQAGRLTKVCTVSSMGDEICGTLGSQGHEELSPVCTFPACLLHHNKPSRGLALRITMRDSKEYPLCKGW